MADDTTRSSLLLRVRDPGDHGSWREFEAQYRQLVLRYCRRRGLQPADADDVQQLVWMHLAKGLRNFEYDPRRGRFRNYLRRVVSNAIAQHFSRPNRAKSALDTSMLGATPDTSDSDSDRAWEDEWVDHHYRLAMRTIQRTFEPRSIDVFERLVAGDSVVVVAKTFGISQQAVYKIKQRIRNRMQELIAEQIQEEDNRDCPGPTRSDQTA